jgi:histidine triad (HIT) family protein
MLRLAYTLLRKPFFYRIFVFMLEHLPFALPVERLRQTESLLAFPHPKPAHPFHVILVPRKAVRSLAELDPADPFLRDLLSATQDLVREHGLPAWRLIVNGGDYQEFPHLHFHLISGDSQND